MSRLLAVAAAVALGVTLVGCGGSPRPRLDPDVAGKPTWVDCQEHQIESLDYVSDTGGKPTARAAIAPYRTSGDHLVVVPAKAHQNRRWLLVDDENRIRTSLEVERSRGGWLVGMVEKCSG